MPNKQIHPRVESRTACTLKRELHSQTNEAGYTAPIRMWDRAMSGTPLSIPGTCSTSGLQNLDFPGVTKVPASGTEVLPREKRE